MLELPLFHELLVCALCTSFLFLCSHHIALKVSEEGDQGEFAGKFGASQLGAQAVTSPEHVEKGAVEAGEEFTRLHVQTPQLSQDKAQIEMYHDEEPSVVGDCDFLGQRLPFVFGRVFLYRHEVVTSI